MHVQILSLGFGGLASTEKVRILLSLSFNKSVTYFMIEVVHEYPLEIFQ